VNIAPIREVDEALFLKLEIPFITHSLCYNWVSSSVSFSSLWTIFVMHVLMISFPFVYFLESILFLIFLPSRVLFFNLDLIYWSENIQISWSANDCEFLLIDRRLFWIVYYLVLQHYLADQIFC
jgi:hypothetical protein